VRTNFDASGILDFVHDLPVGSEEDKKIQGDEGKGDDRPATALHLFMTQRNEHGKALSSWESREAASSSMEAENYRRNWSNGQVRRIDKCLSLPKKFPSLRDGEVVGQFPTIRRNIKGH